MILTINSEKIAIAAEIRVADKVRAKLNSQVRQSKELAQFKIVLRLIEKHMQELSILEKQTNLGEPSLKIEPYLQANTRIKNHIVKKAGQVKQLMNEAQYIPLANLTISCLYKIQINLERIEQKMWEMGRCLGQLQGKIQVDTLIHQ